MKANRRVFKPGKEISFTSNYFPTQTIPTPGCPETVVVGNHDMFPIVGKIVDDHYEGEMVVGVYGYGNQGRSHALNLRATSAAIEGKLHVIVILRRDGKSWKKAIKEGFTEENGTLKTPEEAVGLVDLLLLLIPDDQQVKHYREISERMKKGATLGLAHGFLYGYLKSIGKDFPKHISVIGGYPKGMGPIVYQQYNDGYGTHCTFSVERDLSGIALEVALLWVISIGAPLVSLTTMEYEWKSDLKGERDHLLGTPYGVSTAEFDHFVMNGMTPALAYLNTAANITGPISADLIKGGYMGLYKGLGSHDREIFDRVYEVAYPVMRAHSEETYRQVSAGNEIRLVVTNGSVPLRDVSGGAVWQARKLVKAGDISSVAINAEVAAIYIASAMAQIDVLIANGHSWIEVYFETHAEALWSLNPELHKNGIDALMDGCSRTAQQGAKSRGAVMAAEVKELIIPAIATSQGGAVNLSNFLEHPVHEFIAEMDAYQHAA